MRVVTHSLDETIALGRRLGKLVRSGDIIALDGELGSGKTALVKGLAIGLGITEEVTSPTFTIIHEYQGIIPLYHFDVYRLQMAEQLWDLGYEEYFFDDGVTIIEWASKIVELLPDEYLHINMLYGCNGQQRIIDITARGKRYSNLLEELKSF